MSYNSQSPKHIIPKSLIFWHTFLRFLTVITSVIPETLPSLARTYLRPPSGAGPTLVPSGPGPTCVRAEHSTYLTALSSLASLSPTSTEIHLCLFLANFSSVAASSLRSICVPTRRNGVFWQWCVISGTHWKNATTTREKY